MIPQHSFWVTCHVLYILRFISSFETNLTKNGRPFPEHCRGFDSLLLDVTIHEGGGVQCAVYSVLCVSAEQACPNQSKK
ncbi:hypothetical protein VNO78_10325 [Psophocarpus tetragonolobus]|uniref:Secreted protein n=1 Tax=Psophocarpus tetragonolobus TaxID=3891 RepID=A0AAN9SJM8_PSOTE